MSPTFAWRLTGAVLAMTSLALTGCVSLTKRMVPEQAANAPSRPSMSYEPVRGGLSLEAVSPSARLGFQPRQTAEQWGWVANLAAGAALATATPYRTYQDAALGMFLAGYGLAVLDGYFDTFKVLEKVENAAGALVIAPIALPIYAVLWPIGGFGGTAKKESPGTPAPVDLRQASVKLLDIKGARAVRFTEKNGRYTAFLPLPKRSESSLLLEMSYGRNQITERVELAPADWAKIYPRQVLPPQLVTQVQLEDPRQRNLIEAEQGGYMVVTVTNQAGGAAEGVKAKFTVKRGVPGVTLPSEAPVGDLKVGESRSIRIPIRAAKSIPDGSLSVEVGLEDAFGFDAKRTLVSLQTQALRLPEFVIEQVGLDNRRNGLPERGEQLFVQALIRNKGQGPGRNVRASLNTDNQDLLILDEAAVSLGEIPPGGFSIATYSVFVKHSYTGPDQLPLGVRVEEAHAEAARTLPLVAKLHQTSSRIAEVIVAPTQDSGNRLAAAPSLNVDVDQPLTENRPQDPDAVAVVIGIERYNSQIPQVPFAMRDASMMREYLVKLLGVPSENLIFLSNEQATKGAIETALEGQLPAWVRRGKSNVYVYYAGHGAPDPDSKSPFLVPYDGNPAFAKASCYPMEDFYGSLKALGAKSVTVMLDACFSGLSGRGTKAEALLAQARPVFVDPKGVALPPGVTVLAAASGDQISSGYPQMQHGLFTYYLLKGLRGDASKGKSLTLSDLHSYLTDEVPGRARRMGRTQTPTLLGDGQNRVLLTR